MKKDPFNGKIAKEFIGYMKFSLIFGSIVLLACAIFFFLMALFYENMEYGARIVVYVLASVSLIFSIAYPLTSLALIKIYPKYRNVTRFLVKEVVFDGYEKYQDKK